MNKYFYKILFSALLLMLFGSKISAQSIPELLYYKFDGIGNTVPNMASAPPLGTGTATILGAITQGGTGQCGGALIGSGISATTDYLNTGWATNLTGTSWTISFWSSNITPSATLYYIFGDVGAGGFRCFTNGVAGANNWILRGGFSDVLITGGATVAPHMNTWVYDMSLGNIKAYLDGILVNTVVQAGPTIAGPGPFKVMGYSANIGAPLGGLLDEFRVYNHALSAAEVMNLYTSVTASASNLTICAGGSTTLTGTNATNYTWNPGNIVGNNVLVSPLTTTTYTVTGNDAGCASTATVTITVTPLPNVTASASPAAICSGESSILTGGGANTYLWQPGNLAGSPSVSPLATTTYTVTGTGAGGCSASATVIVAINPASLTPNPVTATPAVLCAGGTSQLNSTAAAGNVQSWYTVPNGGVAIGTSLSGVDFPVTPAVTTTYYAENLDQAVLGGTQTFNFTGGMQTFTVPAGITQITILAKGAQGAAGANGGGNGFGGAGGLGSSAEGILNVVPGDVLNIFVGGQASGGTGGFNGGGNGGNLLAGGGGGASDVRLNSILAANRVIVGAGGGGGGTGGCAVPNVNGGNGGHGNANGTNGITSPNGGGGFAASGATFGAAGIGCAGFLGSPGTSAINEVGGNGGNGQGCCCASTPGGGGGGGGFIGGGGAGGGSAGTVGCIGNDKGGGGGGAGGSSFTGALLSPVLVTGVQSGNGQVVLTWSGGGGTCPSVRVPVTVTVNPAPAITATATPATTCTQTVVTPSASGAPTIAWSGGVTNNIPFIANATTTYTVTGTDGIGCTASTTVLVTVNPMSGILAPASSNQSQDHGDDFNVNYYDASCDLIATVDDGAGGNILGLTTSTVTVDPGFGVHNGQPFVRRWYQITPTNNGAADVVLYINQSDFDNYNLGVALPYLPLPTSGNNADPNISNIRITKNTDAGLGNSPVVITPTVNWNGTYWELSFNTPGFSQFRVHSVNPGNVPLPATVTNFSGVKLESSDKLSWTTSSEQNNAYFNLQHSTDGTNFTTLAKVNSKAQNGNSSVSLNYSSINNKPNLGHNYYRLQQVDMDGKVSVHAQIVDLIWGATGSTVSIYPNPTTDILNIDLYAVKDQNTTVKLLDMSGRVIKQIQAKSAVGMNNIKLSMDEIASGVYTIQVYENNMLSHTSKVKKND
jgi:hypothetical protein